MGRLAPTPSGHLHLGNATAFAAAWLSARAVGGRVLLRFEDVDRSRARIEVERSQRDDLAWLGLNWDEEVAPQRHRDYLPWLEALGDRTYFCGCVRQQLVEAAGGGCPGRCRDRGLTAGSVRFALRAGDALYRDRARGIVRGDPGTFQDPILRRRDGCFTYNLAVVADDVADGVTEVARGADLAEYTLAQIQLWQAFGATPPTWLHAPLILGDDGRKLSKSHGSTEIRAMRAAGVTRSEIAARVLAWLGVEGDDFARAITSFRAEQIPTGPFVAR